MFDIEAGDDELGAGVNQRVALPTLDPQALSLPSEIAVFEDLELNKDLYLWLSAMAAVYEDTGDWIADNRAASARHLGKQFSAGY